MWRKDGLGIMCWMERGNFAHKDMEATIVEMSGIQVLPMMIRVYGMLSPVLSEVRIIPAMIARAQLQKRCSIII